MYKLESRCQSCGKSLGVGFYGTNADGSISEQYCKLCYEKGSFREPDLTLEEMMGRCMADSIDDLKMSQEEAQQLAGNLIPTLKRWRK